MDDLAKRPSHIPSHKGLVGIKGAGYQTLHDIDQFFMYVFFVDGQQCKVQKELLLSSQEVDLFVSAPSFFLQQRQVSRCF